MSRPIANESSPRLLLIRRRYLGDIVLLGSVVRNLRRHWPAAHLELLTEPAYAGVVPLNPEIDRACTFPRRAAEWPGFVRRLRAARFTHVLDFDNTERTALVTRLTGARVRATFDRELIVHRWPWLYTHAARVTNAFYDSHHITETYLALPAAIGVPIDEREVRLVPPVDDLAAAARLTGGPKSTAAPRSPRVLLHPGSRSPYRLWPADRFAAVCDRLQDEQGAQVFLTAGPGEEALTEAIRRAARSHLVTLKPLTSAGALAALAAQCDVFLCHDSGPMHVAAAVGTRIVALFGSQNATIWRPLGEGHTVLQTALPCTCLGSTAPGPCVKGDSYRSYCVRKLEVPEVHAAVSRALR
ncbi:MAG: glycosyltransferase family 9 protein [Verrucomicrobia bacterium]|nr:glycosyltransferase family 9 protein [Verrucomicrobiota bacterium]